MEKDGKAIPKGGLLTEYCTLGKDRRSAWGCFVDSAKRSGWNPTQIVSDIQVPSGFELCIAEESRVEWKKSSTELETNILRNTRSTVRYEEGQHDGTPTDTPRKKT